MNSSSRLVRQGTTNSKCSPVVPTVAAFALPTGIVISLLAVGDRLSPSEPQRDPSRLQPLLLSALEFLTLRAVQRRTPTDLGATEDRDQPQVHHWPARIWLLIGDLDLIAAEDRRLRDLNVHAGWECDFRPSEHIHDLQLDAICRQLHFAEVELASAQHVVDRTRSGPPPPAGALAASEDRKDSACAALAGVDSWPRDAGYRRSGPFANGVTVVVGH